MKNAAFLKNHLSWWTLSCAIILLHFNLPAQSYLGIGWHAGMPIKFDNCCNPYFQAKPVPVSSFSLTYKREILSKKKDKWFYEIGLTSAGLGYNTVEHENDTTHITPWGLYKVRHRGFPSVLLGFGRTIGLKNNHKFALGLEGSYRISHTMGGYISTAFSLEYAVADLTFPLFLRANLGYAIPFKLFGQIPAHLLFYTKISAQDIAKGPQFIRDQVTGSINRDGKYTLNNSEAGVQFYLDIGKQHYNFLDRPPKERKEKVNRSGKTKIKYSIDLQLYSPRPTKYYIPQVDSFSLSGLKTSMTSQIGLRAEFVHFRNTNWSTVVSVGIGRTTETHHFKAIPAFTRDGSSIDAAWGGPIGSYAIQNVGFAYKHDLGKKKLQHTLSICAVEPITKYANGFAISDNSSLYSNIIEGEFLEKYGHHKLLAGVEYNPEILFKMHKRVFFGLGMVFNYTWGVMANGRATVSNGTTTYYGGMLQKFSKIGISARMGFQGKRHLMDF
jgi:hypothetical protein